MKLIVANWKMNGTLDEAKQRATTLSKARAVAKMVVCPPTLHLPAVAEILAESMVSLGAQDCHEEPKGAFTGETSAPMLAEIGCRFVIVGHSERRHGKGETSALVQKKAAAALAANLTPIICVGETLTERDQGKAEAVVAQQITESVPADMLKHVVIAYEPVWAIGTGRNALSDDIEAMHKAIRAQVGAATPLLYGGSVKLNNAAQILQIREVDGLLIGGASLIAEDFIDIARAGMFD